MRAHALEHFDRAERSTDSDKIAAHIVELRFYVKWKSPSTSCNEVELLCRFDGRSCRGMGFADVVHFVSFGHH